MVGARRYRGVALDMQPCFADLEPDVLVMGAIENLQDLSQILVRQFHREGYRVSACLAGHCANQWRRRAAPDAA